MYSKVKQAKKQTNKRKKKYLFASRIFFFLGGGGGGGGGRGGILASRPLGRYAVMTKTMAEFGDGTSSGSTGKIDNEDTRRLVISMQEMMGK